MKLIITILLLFPIVYQAQVTKKPVVYDVVHLKNGKVLFGEIIEFAQKDGDLTFRDQYNRTYSLSREMYDYFEEDKVFQKRVKNVDSLVRPRKIDEFDFHVGLSGSFAGTNPNFKPDSYYLSGSNGMYFYIPICLNLGVGKYFHRQHYFGASMDLKAFNDPSTFSQYNLQYRFQYDAMNNNVARYIPISLFFQTLSTPEYYEIPDPTLPPEPNYYQIEIDTKISSLNLGVGHGFSFIGKDLHYFNVEFLFYKGLFAKHSIITNTLTQPNLQYQTAGVQLKLNYHF